jgi:leucyl-tRNA synthetase
VPTSELRELLISKTIFEKYQKYNSGLDYNSISAEELAELSAVNTHISDKLEEFRRKELRRFKDLYPDSDVQYLLSDRNPHKRKIDIKYVDNDILDIHAAFENPIFAYFKDAYVITELNGDFICESEIDKMSKSYYNVQTPDELVEKFGADTLRCYEMFLGPLEQAKPWDTKGISGVHNFLRKFWRLFHDAENNFEVSDAEPSKEALKTLHKTIKKIQDDLDRFSFNTAVSNFMIATNELTEQKCNNRAILSELLILLTPYAPHITEELWSLLGNTESITKAIFPTFNPDYLVEAEFAYPVSFNGKMRFTLPLPTEFTKEEVEKAVLANEQTIKYLDGNAPKKMIVVPGRIVNIVM